MCFRYYVTSLKTNVYNTSYHGKRNPQIRFYYSVFGTINCATMTDK
jgi:hypothetical protein